MFDRQGGWEAFHLGRCSVATRAKARARSLVVHRSHELVVGRHFHHASHAAAAAGCHLPTHQFVADVAVVRAGNSDRHRNWLVDDVVHGDLHCVDGGRSARVVELENANELLKDELEFGFARRLM